VYEGRMNTELEIAFPKLFKFLNGESISMDNSGVSMDFASLSKSFNFKILAKSKKYVMPFYNNVVVPLMGAGI